MVNFDSVEINEEDRDRDPIAHPIREEDELESALKEMKKVRDEDFETEVLALRNNLDEFVRRRVRNHNTHIGLMNNPTVNEVDIDGDKYQIVGERFFELSQFPEFGDIGEVRWSALAPEDSWGMETPVNRGEHAVGRGRQIEAYQVTLDGEHLEPSEVEALSQDVRIAQETENDFTLDAPRLIAEYDSITEVVENENITHEEFEEELRSAKHRKMVTEDLDLTLKGWMSFIDTNARGIAALERLDESQETVDLGGFRPSYVPPFGTPEGAVNSSGRLSSAIFNEGNVLFATGSDAEADYIEGVLDIENESYREELDRVMSDLDPVVLHDQPGGRISLRNALRVFIEDYGGEATISISEDVERGSDEENYLHDLIDDGLAGIEESNLEGITISLDGGLEQEIQERGYSVEEIERRLENASQGLTAIEDGGFRFGGGEYTLNYENLEDPLYELFASELEELSRRQVNPEEDRDMDSSGIMFPNLILIEHMDELADHGFDRETVSIYRPGTDEEFFGVDIDAQFEEEREDLWEDVEYYSHDDIYREGNIRSPKDMSQELRGLLRAMEDEEIIQINQKQIPDTLKIQIDTSSDHYEPIQQTLPDSGERLENGTATYQVGPEEDQVDSMLLTVMQDNEAVEDYNIEETEEWEIEYNNEAIVMFEYQMDVSIDSVRIAEDPVIFASLYSTEEMEYESNEDLERVSEAVKPFNGKNIPYDSDKVTFETEFQMN